MSEISSGGNFLARRGGIGGIDCPDVVVLVAGLVLSEEDIAAIAAPDIAGDRSLQVRGNRSCLVEGVASPFDPDVSSAFVGLNEGDELTIGGQFGGCDFRVSEKEFPVENWYGRIGLMSFIGHSRGLT